MKMTDTLKKILSALLVFVLVFSLIPLNARAAGQAEDTVVFFSDLHTNSSNDKQSLVKGIFGSIAKNVSTPVSAVFSVGDVFSSNEGQNIANLSNITSYIRSGLGNNNVHVDYVWSDHDRYGGISNVTGLVYGAGTDGIYGTSDDGNYYVYFISMSDMTTDPRYGISTTFTTSKLTNFTNDVAKLDTTKPLFIASHMPLLDNRGDNGHAYQWYQVISAAAEKMDIAFFHGHNHKYDKLNEYFFGKGSTMKVEDNGTTRSVTLNFTHACAGYMEPKSTTSYSSSTSRMEVAMVVTINDDSIGYTTYNSKGIYTGSIGPVNTTIKRDHADDESTDTDPTEPSDEPTTPTEPETPDVPGTPAEGTIWRKTNTISAGKTYMLVNYGYNASGVATYAVNSSAGAEAVEVLSDTNGAYIVNDDLSLAWKAAADGNQFNLQNVQNEKYLRSATYVNGTSGSNISVDSTVNSGSTYTSWSMETKNSMTVLSVRRATSSNYYPVCYNNGTFQAFNSSQLTSRSNWLAVFEKTDEAAHTHSYESTTVDATCSEAGSITYTCTSCGHSYTESTPALGHDYSSVVTAPTCTEEGFTTYTCKVCSHSFKDDSTEPLGHSYSTTSSANCTEDGFVVYTCTVCGHSYNGETVPAFGHSYESTTVPPTCANAGYTTYVCKNCGDTYTGNEVSALGHDYASVITAPTCTQEGFTAFTCNTCGHSYVGNQTAALGHDYVSVVTEPTFETEGFTTHTCKVCGDEKIDSFTPVLNHDYVVETKNATCVEDGYVIHTCATCGYSYTEILHAPGHAYTTVSTDATCTENGSILKTCSVCGHEDTEVIPATGHDYDETTIDPTCSQVGFVTYTCACGHVETVEIPTLEHNFTSYRKDPTCTIIGYTTYVCDDCGYRCTDDYVSALGHNYESTSVAPTCTTYGYTEYTCSNCSDSYQDHLVAAYGHSNTEQVTAPTCTENGYTTFTCSSCGESSTGNYVVALGHSYSCTESGNYLVYTCDTCGDHYSVEMEREFTYEKVTKFLSGNKYVITLYSGKKYYALSHENNKLSAVQVTVSNNEITSDVTDDMLWSYSNKKLFYENGGKKHYLNSTSGGFILSTPTLGISTSSSANVSFTSSKLKLGSYYLRYSGGKVSLSSSATTTYLFIEE